MAYLLYICMTVAVLVIYPCERIYDLSSDATVKSIISLSGKTRLSNFEFSALSSTQNAESSSENTGRKNENNESADSSGQDNILQQENENLKNKLENYKELKIDMDAKKVFDKAKSYLIGWITVGGIALLVIGILGYSSIKNYIMETAKKKLESVTDAEISKIINDVAARQVSELIDKQKDDIEEITRQKINQIDLAVNPLGELKETKAIPRAESPQVDYASYMLPVGDQQNEGCSTGFAAAAALEYQILKTPHERITISPRHLYYFARIRGGFDMNSDTGAHIRDIAAIMLERGGIPEDVWPYIAGKYMDNPPAGVETVRHYKITEKHKLNSLDDFKAALQNFGPVILGIFIYRSGFLLEDINLRSGVIPDPEPHEQAVGGHAVCAVGYDDKTGLVKFRNSWGENWGDNGYGYISYNYLSKNLIDSWAIVM